MNVWAFNLSKGARLRLMRTRLSENVLLGTELLFQHDHAGNLTRHINYQGRTPTKYLKIA